MKTDEEFMRRAIELAGKGFTSPNPMVGCVIVKDGGIIAEGFHGRAGRPHAEAAALKKLRGGKAKGATMYVNLEPCRHFGRTPPCTDAIILAGIKRVVAAMKDPNPQVAGEGFKTLRKAGVKVEVGVLGEEAERLNEAYVHFLKKKRPYVILKSAMSLDGKIASATGDSKWVTGEKARRVGRILRGRADAVVVGIGTVMKDDPRLTCRIRGGRDPLRVIVDSMLRIPLKSRALADDNALIATTRKHDKKKRRGLERAGVKVVVADSGDGRVSLRKLVKKLGESGVRSVLIEGGGELNASALKEGLVDKAYFFIAPKIVGGRNAKTPVEGEGAEKIGEAIRLSDTTVEKIGEDFLVTGYPKY